jgi:hypothetical protein
MALSETVKGQFSCWTKVFRIRTFFLWTRIRYPGGELITDADPTMTFLWPIDKKDAIKGTGTVEVVPVPMQFKFIT